MQDMIRDRKFGPKLERKEGNTREVERQDQERRELVASGTGWNSVKG